MDESVYADYEEGGELGSEGESGRDSPGLLHPQAHLDLSPVHASAAPLHDDDDDDADADADGGADADADRDVTGLAAGGGSAPSGRGRGWGRGGGGGRGRGGKRKRGLDRGATQAVAWIKCDRVRRGLSGRAGP
jgi:hypothetical protein